MDNTKNSKLIIAALIILAAAAIVVYLRGDVINRQNISKEKAADLAMEFINKGIQADVTASLIEITDEGQVYGIHLEIAGTEYQSYITKDGKLLFPNGFDLEEAAGNQQLQEDVSAADADLSLFAQCISDSGAEFYGAFWCQYCKNQKEMFGSAQQFLPYVECSTEDGNSQLDVCNEQEITDYPTWIFSDGSRESGEIPLQKLSEKTGCQLPESSQ